MLSKEPRFQHRLRRYHRVVRLAGWTGWIALWALGACGDGIDTFTPTPSDPDCYADPDLCIDNDGVHYQYVINSIEVPASATRARELGFDLDGDPQDRPDNSLGQSLATLGSQTNVDLQAAVDTDIAAGAPITLIDLQATNLSDALNVGTWVLFGADPNPEPCANETDTVCGRHLSGDGQFGIDPTTPDDAVPGDIADRQLLAGPGRITVRLPLGPASAEPLTFHLIGAFLELTVNVADGTLTGRLGGGVLEQEYCEDLGVDLALAHIEPMVAADCPNATPPCCVEGSTGETLVDLYDENDDCQVTRGELRPCELVGGAPSPFDLDLLDENGTYNPRSDGIKDSMSFALGFTAVGASFELPGPAQ